MITVVHELCCEQVCEHATDQTSYADDYYSISQTILVASKWLYERSTDQISYADDEQLYEHATDQISYADDYRCTGWTSFVASKCASV